jgi:hypothetical protein
MISNTEELLCIMLRGREQSGQAAARREHLGAFAEVAEN